MIIRVLITTFIIRLLLTLKKSSMNTYSILGTIVSLIPLALIVGILIKQGKKIFDQ